MAEKVAIRKCFLVCCELVSSISNNWVAIRKVVETLPPSARPRVQPAKPLARASVSMSRPQQRRKAPRLTLTHSSAGEYS